MTDLGRTLAAVAKRIDAVFSKSDWHDHVVFDRYCANKEVANQSINNLDSESRRSFAVAVACSVLYDMCLRIDENNFEASSNESIYLKIPEIDNVPIYAAFLDGVYDAGLIKADDEIV